MQEVIFWGIWAVLGLIMLLYYLRRKRRVLSLLVGAGSAAFYTANNKKRGHLIKRCPRILSRIDFVRKLTSVR